MTTAAQQNIVVWSEYAIQCLNWELLDSTKALNEAFATKKLTPAAYRKLEDEMRAAAEKHNSSKDIAFACEIRHAVELYDKNWKELARMGFRRRSWVIAEVERKMLNCRCSA